MSACIDRIIVNKCECSDEDKRYCETGFAPIGDVSENGDEIIINDSCKLLILGTFPGKDSLDKGEYYCSSQNSFRKLVFEKYNQDLDSDYGKFDYGKFVETLRNHNIAVWDAFKKCKRRTSLDKDIECALPNDFSSLPRNIEIVFNGKLRKGRLSREIKQWLGKEFEFNNIQFLYSTSNNCASSKEKRELRRREWLNILP